MSKDKLAERASAITYMLTNNHYHGEEQRQEMIDELNELKVQIEEENIQEDAAAILEDRKIQYGTYKEFSKDMANIMTILKQRKFKNEIITIEDVDNFFLVLKLMRLQTASDIDSLIDLENYSKLIRERKEDNE